MTDRWDSVLFILAAYIIYNAYTISLRLNLSALVYSPVYIYIYIKYLWIMQCPSEHSSIFKIGSDFAPLRIHVCTYIFRGWVRAIEADIAENRIWTKKQYFKLFASPMRSQFCHLYVSICIGGFRGREVLRGLSRDFLCRLYVSICIESYRGREVLRGLSRDFLCRLYV